MDLHNNYMVEPFIQMFESKGYKWFDGNKPYNVNIFGIRTMEADNKFDDFMFLVYRDKWLRWVINQYPITTDPGTTSLVYPENIKGTAVLVPDQYLGAYAISRHRGKYDALCQVKDVVTVYRDKDRDKHIDIEEDSIDRGYFGINIHRSSFYESDRVNGWSAGCQVFKKNADFTEFMARVKLSASIYGNRFTYTLFDENDLLIEPE